MSKAVNWLVDSVGKILRPRVSELFEAAEFIPDRLYFAPLTHLPRDDDSTHYFSVDRIYRYMPFFHDFGPLHLGHLYRFCILVNQKLADESLRSKRIVFFCDNQETFRANAACLITCYAILFLEMPPQEACGCLGKLRPFISFRDASGVPSHFKLTVEHCVRALHRAVQLNIFNFQTFNVEEYEFYERVDNGDFNIIIPNKFLAFSGPMTYRSEGDQPMFTPNDYAPIFKKLGVTTIIRLNRKMYDAGDFTKQGFQHADMFFTDGGTPSAEIVQNFLDVCENSAGLIAVHCKAGLGRTGTLIACYMMKHYQFTAEEAIAWLRICRPGSVIGPQQFYLKSMEAKMFKAGKQYRKLQRKKQASSPLSPVANGPAAPPSPTKKSGRGSALHRDPDSSDSSCSNTPLGAGPTPAPSLSLSAGGPPSLSISPLISPLSDAASSADSSPLSSPTISPVSADAPALPPAAVVRDTLHIRRHQERHQTVEVVSNSQSQPSLSSSLPSLTTPLPPPMVRSMSATLADRPSASSSSHGNVSDLPPMQRVISDSIGVAAPAPMQPESPMMGGAQLSTSAPAAAQEFAALDLRSSRAQMLIARAMSEVKTASPVPLTVRVDEEQDVDSIVIMDSNNTMTPPRPTKPAAAMDRSQMSPPGYQSPNRRAQAQRFGMTRSMRKASESMLHLQPSPVLTSSRPDSQHGQFSDLEGKLQEDSSSRYFFRASAVLPKTEPKVPAHNETSYVFSETPDSQDVVVESSSVRSESAGGQDVLVAEREVVTIHHPHMPQGCEQGDTLMAIKMKRLQHQQPAPYEAAIVGTK